MNDSSAFNTHFFTKYELRMLAGRGFQPRFRAAAPPDRGLKPVPRTRSVHCAPAVQNRNCSPWGKRGGEADKVPRRSAVGQARGSSARADALHWAKAASVPDVRGPRTWA